MSGRGGGSDNSDAGIFLTVIIFAVIWIILTQKWEWIAPAWRYLRIAEFFPISFIPESFPVLGKYQFGAAFDFLVNTPAERISRQAAELFDQQYGSLFRWPAAMIIGFLAFKLFKSSMKKSTRHNMDTLLSKMTEEYSFNGDMVSVNPAKMSYEYYDADSKKVNQYAIALTPMEFATMTPPPGLTTKGKEKPRPILDGDDFDHDLARRAFDAQIGNPFVGIDHLSENQKKVYSYLVPKLPGKEKHAIEVMTKHAFVITGLMALLDEARGGGVVAPLEFRWLKYQDRTLWYALTSVGRKTAFVEAAGPFAHWLLETHLGRAISHKETTEAVEALYGAVMPDKD